MFCGEQCKAWLLIPLEKNIQFHERNSLKKKNLPLEKNDKKGLVSSDLKTPEWFFKGDKILETLGPSHMETAWWGGLPVGRGLSGVVSQFRGLAV